MNNEERWTPDTIKGLVMDAMPTMQHLGANLGKAVPEGPMTSDICIALIAIGTVLLKQANVSYENYLELCACLYQRSILVEEPQADA